MSYVEANLLQGERVIHIGKVHWIVFAPAVLLLVFAAGFSTLNLVGAAMIVGLVALLKLLAAALVLFGTELAITNRRVIAKTGLIRRESIELSHRKVESYRIRQGLLGRLLNYGTVVVCGTGSGQTAIPNIVGPMAFRKSAMIAAEARGAA